jgi:hypothetical protein
VPKNKKKAVKKAEKPQEKSALVKIAEKFNIGSALVEKLHPWPGNPRDNDDSVEDVVASIKAHGFLSPIVVWPDEKFRWMVIAGHVRLKAAKQLKMKNVPIIVADDITREQAESYALSDNKTAEKAAWNLELLQKSLKGLKVGPPGFRADEIQAILSGQLNIRANENGKKKKSVLDSLVKKVKCPECGHKFEV